MNAIRSTGKTNSQLPNAVFSGVTFWTKEEDSYLKQVARYPSRQIATMITEKFGIVRTPDAVLKRRRAIAPEHLYEPVGLTRLIDIAWTSSEKYYRRADPYIKRRAIDEGVLVIRMHHGKRIELVPNDWADAIVDEVDKYRNEWLSTRAVAKMFGLTKGDYALNAHDSAEKYPMIRACRRIYFGREYRWHPEDAAVAAREFRDAKNRQRWLRKHWWNSKQAAEHMRVKVDVLRNIVFNRNTYWGAPLSMLKREKGDYRSFYYEPESVRAFTAKMDEQRLAKKDGRRSSGVDRA